ncbi:alternative sulfate transporter [Xylogone sp. PMI_703]|nr:alternative sulfate transporter [Xylogone sp. PMI_703]
MAVIDQHELYPDNEKSTVAIEGNIFADSQNDSSASSMIDWTEEEEKKVVRKLDCIVMPLLMLGFVALQLDRGNIGNTLTDNFLKDVGISQDQFNVGQQLMSLGIVLLEIPSNMILYRLGPSIWISGQIFAWGLVATFQAFQKNLGPYLVTRLFLGLCESGFIPAGLFTITMWYKRDETSKRFAWFFIGNMGAQAATGLIAYGILHMRGVAGLTGWQWLFILEGLFTIVVSFILASLFPGVPNKAKSLLGVQYFSERELHIIRQRVLLDDPTKATGRSNITRKELTTALGDWRIYPHLLMTICALGPSGVFWSYAPTLVHLFGYPALKSNALVSVGGWILLVTNISAGFIADRVKRRGPVVLGFLVIWWAFALGNLILALNDSTHKVTRYAILTLAIGFSSPWHAVNGSWLALNARSPGERSIRMAMFIMSANCSGIVGSQLFQAKDAPKYHTGWTVIVCLVSTGIVFAIFNVIQYWISNKRIDAKNREGGVTEGSEKQLKRYYT